MKYEEREINKKEIHVVPTKDTLRPIHDDSPQCWCNPELHYKDGDTEKEVWVHRGYEELDQ